MEDTARKHVKGKRKTRTTASARRAKAAEYPSQPKRTRKRQAQAEPEAMVEPLEVEVPDNVHDDEHMKEE
ncbi:hypothetical protein A2U01_0038136, partial [Trifolium medium]|nr:hypothetical protein [Trifolium medium]